MIFLLLYMLTPVDPTTLISSLAVAGVLAMLARSEERQARAAERITALETDLKTLKRDLGA